MRPDADVFVDTRQSDERQLKTGAQGRPIACQILGVQHVIVVAVGAASAVNGRRLGDGQSWSDAVAHKFQKGWTPVIPAHAYAIVRLRQAIVWQGRRPARIPAPVAVDARPGVCVSAADVGIWVSNGQDDLWAHVIHCACLEACGNCPL